MLQTTETKADNYILLEVNGRLDTTTSGSLEEKVKALGAEKNNLVMALENMDYISSSGLRVFLMALKMQNANQKKLLLYGMQANVNKVFKISGFSSIFFICADKAEALAQL